VLNDRVKSIPHAMPAATHYTLIVDDRPLWAATSHRQVCELAAPYIAEKREVRIRSVKDCDLIAECEYDYSAKSWREVPIA